ncbi:MAG: 1-deoxy-D-xylulose-5-phosphate synthase [Eggerthellaceae bacterium]|jgi:1-deoxy-D-xylulose-5-phosphate synthase|nr:1-deoxy-D-xylulose-5-phosphate synthase [Eggerthellaceae bacterium]MCH4220438.1 1-deoxy-D-xylulose-5-phosphate synthase [Eggerthellaceae bacterium]
MAEKRILDAITSPDDLKALTDGDLRILCNEIREEIVSVTSRNGGHVASSLGAVEIIVALHSLLNCPHDRIVFDVGHQAYAHKLLTGRLKQFDTLRQKGGISGFPKPSESPYDVHPSGHASDSLSVALGLAKARDLRGSDEHIVAVIGDASLAGGMAFEALNHIGQEQTKIVIVLNDNGMSISRPVGGLVKHLGFLRTSTQYRRTRDALQERMEESGIITRGLLNVGRNMKESIKQFVIPHSMMFEHLGITCTAPIDGHDIRELRETLEVVLKADGPVLVHVVTKKGIGYPPAQQNPELFHGVGPFDIKTGHVYPSSNTAPKFMNVFRDAIVDEAAHDPSIVAITAAMKDGTGLARFADTYPDRFYDVGISEEHALGFAAGLASGGMKPVVAIYSTFMQRAIDQIIVDNALARCNIVLCIDRAGLVGDDGPTHNGMFDMVYLRMIPEMRILAPSNEAELVNALHTALKLDGPVALRYPRGAAAGVALPDHPIELEPGVSRLVRKGDDIAILAFGRMVAQALDAAEILEQRGIHARVVDMRWVKPFDENAIKQAAQTKLVVTLEEGVISGGAGEGVLDVLSHQASSTPSLVLGLPDAFIPQGKVEDLFADLGLDGKGIAASISEALQR